MCKVKRYDMQNSDIKWVTEKEVEQLRKWVRETRYPVRNELMILMLYRHGLRESELCNLRLDQIDFEQAKIHIKRLKGSNSFSHPITGDELHLIRRYIRTKVWKQGSGLPWFFVSERGNQLSRFTVIKNIQSCRIEAGFIKNITPHMLRLAVAIISLIKVMTSE